MSDPAQASPPAGNQPPTAATTTVVRRRTEQRRPPLLINLLGLVVDAIVVGAVLVLLNVATLRDSVFAVGVSQGGGASTPAPLLDRGFLNLVLPWLDGVLVFAFVVRTLGRFARRGFLTLLLGLVARVAGAAVIVYMLRQPVIFTAPHGAAAPFGGGSLQAFAEYWGRAALIVALVLTSLGALAGLVALLRDKREQSA
jgi:hypothetical protein